MSPTSPIIGKAEFDGEVKEILDKYFSGHFRPEGYRKYRNVTLPACHSRFAERIENFEVRDDDVYVMSYPKTGKLLSISFSIILCSTMCDK